MESTAVKRCLITGASGLIGSQLITELCGDWEVHALSRHPRAMDEDGGVIGYGIDLADAWDASVLPDRMDAVIYLAQSERFREFPEAAEEVFQVNTVSVLRLLEYARRAGARTFIFASSGGVYGTGERDFSEDLDISVSGDLGFYLSTKVCSEIVAANYTPFMSVVVLRFFFVYGPGQRRSMLIPRLIESVRQGTPIRLQGREGIRLNPTHVDDAVRATCRALELTGSHTINVGGPEVLTLRQIGDIIGRLAECEPVYEVDEEAVPRHLTGGIEKMSRLLCPPRVRFADGVSELIEPPRIGGRHAIRGAGATHVLG